MTFILDEIEDFTREMKELGQKYHSGILSDWADRLFKELQTYAMEKIKETLTDFSKLTEDIEKRI